MNVLFICSRNRLRSLTAEAIFALHEGVHVLSAGTGADAETPLSADLLEWADVIFAMEGIHRRRLKQRFPLITSKKRIIVLGICDRYRYMAPELVEVLEAKVFQYLKC